MRILIGYTVYPNSSIVEMTIRPENPTPYVNSFLFWANPSVHCDTNYQVIFPPSVEYVTQHHKREMTTWPVADRYYNRFDYTGLDISMWKNTGVPSSFFSWDPQEDFFGGYDHGKQAGTVWVGNHYICPGMKYWADGNNSAGEMINDGLTDTDGRYIELMAGAYTDNQPDYSWIQPYESRDVTMTWYPIRLLGGLKEANRNAALNLVSSDSGEVSIRLNTTQVYRNARVDLTYMDKEKLNERIDISPDKPWSKDLDLDGPIEQDKIKFSLYDASGELLLEYQQEGPPGKPMPEPLESPPAPHEVKSVEELYLIGLRLDQFFNASVDPYPYYFEALKRDPGDYRVNTQLGILYCKRKMWEEAERHLQQAVDRITMRYTRSKDSDALYYLGIVKRRLQKNEEAYGHFYDATWNAGWHTPAYHQLAELDCEAGKFEKALEHINRALDTDVRNRKALGLKIIILRKLGMLEEAGTLAASIMENDPLDHQSRNEYYLINKELKRYRKTEAILDELERIMQDREQSYIELSLTYSNCGFYKEAIDILSRAIEKGNTYPMLYYYCAYFWSKLGEREKASEYFKQAQAKPHRFCFPSRDEAVNALNEALAYDPNDAMACYYLGNLYYELQPEKAIVLWEKSLSIDDGFYIVLRNLALAAEEHQHDLAKSLALYKKAFENNRNDPRLIYEYDNICEQANISPAERYEQIFKGNRDVISQRSETFLRELDLLNFLGQYDEVIDVLKKVEFVESEGSSTLRDVFHNAFILRALKEADTGNYQAAITDMQEALDFPIGRWGSERRAQMNYLMGTFYELSGDIITAKTYWERAIAEITDGTEYSYEKGLTIFKTGQRDEAMKHFRALQELADRGDDSGFFRSFEGGASGAVRQAQNHYLRGLAYLGMGHRNEARAEFKRALKLDQAHLWARIRLEEE
jgi:tetratricopeptide (TPR) repeat protein